MSEKNTNKPSKTDWARIDALTDNQIDTSDIPPLDEAFFKTAKWRKPHTKVTVTVEVESEVMDWFKAQGADYQRYLSAALKIYAEAHQAVK
jgi:uncharacterized protein (DUF4415 family)